MCFNLIGPTAWSCFVAWLTSYLEIIFRPACGKMDILSQAVLIFFRFPDFLRIYLLYRGNYWRRESGIQSGKSIVNVSLLLRINRNAVSNATFGFHCLPKASGSSNVKTNDITGNRPFVAGISYLFWANNLRVPGHYVVVAIDEKVIAKANCFTSGIVSLPMKHQ